MGENGQNVSHQDDFGDFGEWSFRKDYLRNHASIDDAMENVNEIFEPSNQVKPTGYFLVYVKDFFGVKS